MALNVYLVIGWVTIWLSTALFLVIALYHIKTTHQNEPLKCIKYDDICMRPSLYISHVLLFAGLVALIQRILINASWTWSTSLSECYALAYTAAPTYTLFKSLMYSVLVSRTWESYGQSGMGYSKKWLIIWIVILIIYSIFNAIFSVKTVGVLEINGQCVFTIFPPFLMSMMLMDIIACIINTYLFIKPIIILNKTLKEMEAKAAAAAMANKQTQIQCVDVGYKETNADLKKVAVKQAILSGIAVWSTILQLLFLAVFNRSSAYGAMGGVAWDMVISTFCIILMYKWYSLLVDRLSSVLCCCCAAKQTSKENIKKLEIVVKTGTQTESTQTASS